MKQRTISSLLEINKNFYTVVEPEFNGTRQKPWEGWLKLLPFIWQTTHHPTILDLGCGNGRFGEFLSQHVEDITYIGIDQNEGLLRTAKNKLPQGKFIIGDLTELSFLKELNQPVDIISLIAVLHHIPSFSARKKILEYSVKKLSQHGLLIFTAWQFLSIEQLKNRIIDWSTLSQLESTDLEENDYIIDWQRGQHAIRYCHLITAKEIEALIEGLQLTKVAQFFADGKNGKSNIYVVLKKE